MVFPIGDDNSGRTTTPVVNYLLIAVNVLVFVFFQGLGSNTASPMRGPRCRARRGGACTLGTLMKLLEEV